MAEPPASKSPTDDPLAIDRVGPTRRPDARLAGYHVWSDLLFAHWRVPAAMVQALVPQELSVDTWDGSAWVGLVPFYMSRIRPWWAPALPGVSWFCETNVRTYVHFRGKDPGVWFFSLDASNSLAVRMARWGWRLPYFRAEMTLKRAGQRVEYSSRRLWPGEAGAGTRIVVEAGDLQDSDVSLPPAQRTPPGNVPPGSPATDQRATGHRTTGYSLPGSFEHFLIERYILYAQAGPGLLLKGHVHHTPYPVRSARLVEFEQSLLPAAGIPLSTPPDHVAFSDGVQVHVFSLQRIRC